MQKKTVFLVLFTFALLAFYGSAAAQSDSPPEKTRNYEINIRSVFGSNKTVTGSTIPKDLKPAVGHLKTSFDYSNFAITGIYDLRISERGRADIHNIGDIFLPGRISTPLVFTTIGFSGIAHESDDLITFQSVRFGERISLTPDAAAEPNYQFVGIDLNRFALEPNTWVNIGTLMSPIGDGTIFVFVHVKPL